MLVARCGLCYSDIWKGRDDAGEKESGKKDLYYVTMVLTRDKTAQGKRKMWKMT